MRRRHIHAGFAAVLVLGIAVATVLSVRLHRARAWNEDLDLARRTGGEPAAALQEDAPTVLQLARAQVLAKAGRTDEALALYRRLIKASAGSPLRPELQYHLGNLHLREGLRLWAERPDEAHPRVELAKQSYREALRENPQDWDARYNLERALWLAPELEPPPPDEELPPEAKERTISTLPGSRLDLP